MLLESLLAGPRARCCASLIPGIKPSPARRAIRMRVSAESFHIDGVLGPIHAGDSLHEWPYRADDFRPDGAIAGFAGSARRSWPAIRIQLERGRSGLPAACRCSVRCGRHTALVHGQLDVHNLRLTNSAINEPILVSAASVEFSPGERRVEIGGVQALDATLEGLSAAEIGKRKLDVRSFRRPPGPRATRPRAWAEQAGFALSALAVWRRLRDWRLQAEAAIARISAQGRLHLDELAIGALRLDKSGRNGGFGTRQSDSAPGPGRSVRRPPERRIPRPTGNGTALQLPRPGRSNGPIRAGRAYLDQKWLRRTRLG